jgi:XRE family transcriptional regulator, fatty acid utilization regulator
MRKTFMGVRLKRLREERGLTQIALAHALDLSPSYLNQLEKNQRPLTVPVLLKINAVFGVDVQLFSEDDEARMIAALRDVFADPAGPETIALSEVRELAASMPAVGRAILALHRRYRFAMERSDAIAAQLGLRGDSIGAVTPLMPYEQVRDFFHTHNNYFAELDEAAEALFVTARLTAGQAAPALAAYLKARHDIRVVQDGAGDELRGARRVYQPDGRILRLSRRLGAEQQAFEMATQLGLIEMAATIDRLAAEAAAGSRETHALARIGLANHFAGALLMPYRLFLQAAEAVRYDIEELGERFGLGFETICHRLSTLQRPNARGVPFFFVRVDRAGNISKRQSATDFHFSRVGGTCPLWNVYQAFAQPERILTQIARMPDERTYLWIARSVASGGGGYRLPRKTFAVALGCDIQHAERLVYSDGLDLKNPAAATPIGAGCKICDRPACPQRAFPPMGRPLRVDENRSAFAPYAAN